MRRFAALQFKARPDRERGLRALCKRIRGTQADLIVCPECALEGYALDDESAATVAQPADGVLFQALSPLARLKKAWIVCGFVERDADRIFNAALVVNPAGERAFVYRKTLLFEADTWCSPGDSGYPSLGTDFGRLGVGICMDLNDDRFLAHAAAHTDILAFPTNWVQEEGDVHEYWRFRLHRGWPADWEVEHTLLDRASFTGLLLAANSHGIEGAYTIAGRSAALTRGGILAQAPESGDHTVLVRGSQHGMI